MLRILMICILSFCVESLHAKPSLEIPPLHSQAQELFEISNPIILQSDDGIKHQIMIAKTKPNPKSRLESKPYRILYILDGNAQLPLAINAYINDIKINRDISLILVGIGYEGNLAYDTKKRTKDYLPQAKDSSFKGSGGAEEFALFIQEKILPLLQSKYTIDSTHQGIFGHSFGGIFTFYMLLNHHDSFSHYFITSPSMWWDNASFMDSIPKLSSCVPTIFIMKGSLESKEINQPNSVMTKLNENTNLSNNTKLPNALDMANLLKAKGCVVTYKEFEGKTHGGVITDALMFALETLSDENP